MVRRSTLFGYGARRCVAVILGIALIGLSTSAAAATSTHAKKRLSLNTVTVGSLWTGVSYPEFTAVDRGYFKQQGLNVTLMNTTAAASDVVASLVSGAWNFAITPTEATTVAEDQGGAIRPVMAAGYSTSDELAIAGNIAAADNIPASGLAAQTRALKGSHLSIGISNTTSGTYLDLVAYLQKNGLTWSGPNSDVSFQTLGSATILTTALASGKIDAIANTPPVTVVSGDTIIAFGGAPPIKTIVWESLDTTLSMIQQHADTVQAFVTAATQGWLYDKTHAASVLKEATPYFVTAGITSPEEIDYLVAENLARVVDVSPAITRTGFNGYKYVLDIASTPVTRPFGQLVDNQFVDKAIKALGMTVPT